MTTIEHERLIEKLPYRPSVGLMILNAKLEVFVGKRVDSKAEAWQMPQGGIDEGETPKQAAFREMKEEIGTNNGLILGETKLWYHYDLPFHLVQKLWQGKYRGQRQKWFLIKYIGDNSEIDIQGQNPEFLAWKWTKIENLTDIIVPFKKNLYISVIEEFRDLIIALKDK